MNGVYIVVMGSFENPDFVAIDSVHATKDSAIDRRDHLAESMELSNSDWFVDYEYYEVQS